MKYGTVREMIIQLCFFTIALCLLVPAIGWGATLGLWVLLTANNFEQDKRMKHYADHVSARSVLFSSILSKASSQIPTHVPGEVWDANEELRNEVEEISQPEEEEEK